jgi:hypothetical protein
MSRRRFLTLLIAAVLAISGALYLSTQRNLPRDTRSIALLPSLAGELNTVSALSVRRASASPTATLHEHDGGWSVAERGDYPADVSKLRKLLLALSDARIMEEKTSNPANFSAIGVEDPSLPTATGAEVSVTARDGKHAVIIGKPAGAGNFARRAGENKSYTVEPGITFESEPRFWIDSRLLDVPVAGIQSIQVKPSALPAYTVRRDASGANFALDGAPPGRKAADSASLVPSTLLSGLTADDVAPAGGIDFGKATVATVTLSDGNVITMSGAASGDKHWVQVQASKDAALNAKAAGRAFEIPSYRFDAIFRPLEQMLAPAAAPSGVKTAPTKKPAPASKP